MTYNEEDWEEITPTAGQPRRRLAAIVSVRFAPGEVDVLRAAAESRSQKLSEFIRSAALAAAGHGAVQRSAQPKIEPVTASSGGTYDFDLIPRVALSAPRFSNQILRAEQFTTA